MRVTCKTLSFWKIFVVLLLSMVEVTLSTMLAICDKQTRYEYDIDMCPGGIQIRDFDHWFSKSRDHTCICGEGAMLQFNGKTEEWDHNIYPVGFPPESMPVLGSWSNYNLSMNCEMLQEHEPSALFIDAKKYQDPVNFPSRAIELFVEEFQSKRLAGVFKIAKQSGQNNRGDVQLPELLRTIMLNNEEPLLIREDPKAENAEYACSYNPTSPEVVVSKYISTTWGNQDLPEQCEKKLFKPYNRTSYHCLVKCESMPKFDSDERENGQPVLQFREFMMTMAEIAMRLKYLEKIITFQYQNHPYAAILQDSCRVFHRAFPTVVSLETLMNAVTLFGIAFEGLIPTHMDNELFNQVKIFLGRCTVQEGRRQKDHSKLLGDMCDQIKNAVELELNSSIATVTPTEGQDAGQAQQKIRTSFGGPHNIVIELLWKVVQFVHASCLSSVGYFPNTHHAYTSAMIEIFSQPAVQLLWYQQGKYDYRQLGKVMIHIFPELPEHVLPTMELLLGKMQFQTYFGVLTRPKMTNLDERDMRCAGHGKLIWGGKACCYQNSEDKKYYYFNKVAFAKL